MELNRKLKMGMIGGGPGAFIGEVHRKASRMDGGIELVAGAFDINPRKSKQQGRELMLDPKRVYGTYQQMIERELKLPKGERIYFFSSTTPNSKGKSVDFSDTEGKFNNGVLQCNPRLSEPASLTGLYYRKETGLREHQIREPANFYGLYFGKELAVCDTEERISLAPLGIISSVARSNSCESAIEYERSLSSFDSDILWWCWKINATECLGGIEYEIFRFVALGFVHRQLGETRFVPGPLARDIVKSRPYLIKAYAFW